jgi:hypothetical protein
MGGVVGGVLGYQASQNQLDAANQARQQALGQWTGLTPPSVADQQLNLQQYGNTGDLTNQTEQALQMGPSAMTQVQTDPRLMQAQMAALQQLQQTGQMGMTPAEHAALVQAQQNAAAQAQAKSKQVLNEFAARGMGGSGAELAAQLSNAQNSAQMLANNSNQVAQNAQQNALQAISQAGTLGGQMQGQQFGQQSAIAQARDYINQFNLQNAQNVGNTNVGLANQANQFNLMKNQNLANMNAQLLNQQQEHNKQLSQQQFNNQVALAGGRSGQYQGVAQAQQQQASNTANMWAGIGQGVDTGAGALYNAYNKTNNTGGTNTATAAPTYGGGLTESEMAGGPSPSEQAGSEEEAIYGG